MTETSIIVRAFNEARHLPALFDAIDAQEYRDFEVILVDSGSYDRTREIAAARGAKICRISSHDFTFGYSLNVGIEAAQGRFIVIVSAHTIPTASDWLENLIAPLKTHDNIAMVYGRQIGVAESKFSEAEDFERIFGVTPREDRPRKIRANNAASAIKKSLWEKKKFNPEVTGLEDADWASHWLRRGMRVVYEPSAVIRHIHEESWPQIRRRYFREAVAARRMGLLGRRHIPREILREIRHLTADLRRCFSPRGNPAAIRLSLFIRFIDVTLFRLFKIFGTFEGLTARNPLSTKEARQAAFFDRANRSVVVHGPDKAKLEVRDLPTVKPGEALISVQHVAICATDLEIYDGTLGYYRNGTAQYPIVPGHEFSGRIAALGTNVNGLNEGQAIVVECIQSCGVCPACLAGNPIGCPDRAELGVLGRDGAYAEYLTVPAKFVHPVPETLSLDKATLTEPVAVVLKGLRRLETRFPTLGKPWRVAVLGAGPLGHICARVLAYKGHAVTAFDRNDARLSLFTGSEISVSPTLEGLERFDALVELTGDPDVLDKALKDSRANAALLLLGLPYGERNFSFEEIAAYDKTVIGSVGSTAEDFDHAIDLLRSLELNEHLKCRLPLDRFSEGWEIARNGRALKVILDLAPSA